MTKEAVPAAKLRVAAVTPFTTIDFPGKLSAVVFVQGCPWRCPYCHNPWMQPREFAPDLEHGSWQGLLDGVVVSGGEPTIDPALPAAVERVRELGYLAALHTGGAYPAHFAEVAGRLSWVGLDVKASPDLPDAFDRAAGRTGACAKFLETYRTLREAGIEYECRTTVHPTLHDEAGLMRLADWLEAEGASPLEASCAGRRRLSGRRRSRAVSSGRSSLHPAARVLKARATKKAAGSLRFRGLSIVLTNSIRPITLPASWN